MSKRPPHGGSAHPHGVLWDNERTGYFDAERGMTLRDWFAGQALIGLGTWTPDGSSFGLDRQKSQAEWAYGVADAMLRERAK